MVYVVFACTMGKHGWNQKSHDNCREQPGRTEDERFRQGEVNPHDSGDREYDLPTRLRLIDFGHFCLLRQSPPIGN
jgi:hypothetical protein